MPHKVFGKNPSGKRLQQIRLSPNYREHAFRNLTDTPVMAEDGSFWKTFREYFKDRKAREPKQALPVVKTPLQELTGDPALVWFGHSSYFIGLNGLRILVDPVLSNSASPVSFMAKGFRGTAVYDPSDIPDIDLLLLTHDHYDHLDYPTITRLKARTKKFCVALGVGSHLEYWGVPPDRIKEFDWWDEAEVAPGISLAAAPARHFSGRGLRRGKTLWVSFVLKAAGCKLYLGGDSGYDSHFADIGKKLGPFDMAVLECGQYNASWPHIHMMPEETVQASIDLKSQVLLPVHWGKFTLALHPWDEPVQRVVQSAGERKVQITTPMIGETVQVGRHYPSSRWWVDAKF